MPKSLGGPPPPPIDTYSAQFYLLNLKTTKQHVALAYDKVVAAFLVFYRAKHRPEEFSVLDVLDYRQHLIESGHTVKTVNRRIEVLAAFWQWMIDVRGLALVNVARMKGLAEAARFVYPPLTIAQIQGLVACVREERFRRVVFEILAGADTKAASKAAGVQPKAFYTFFRAVKLEAGLHWLTPSRLRRSARSALVTRGLESLNYLPSSPVNPVERVEAVSPAKSALAAPAQLAIG